MSYQMTIVSDKNNWINEYIPVWIEELKPKNLQVIWVHDIQDIEPGELVFFLGCEQIVGKSLLSRNRHNLVVHASDLPQGKGWSPLTWKILSGQNDIPVVLFEAAENVDSGNIYLRHVMKFNGYELIGELRKQLALTTLKLCNEFLANYPDIVQLGKEQIGESSYYPRRTPRDSQISPELSIRDQFNQLRVADNERYPCFFELGGETFILKIEKKVSGNA